MLTTVAHSYLESISLLLLIKYQNIPRSTSHAQIRQPQPLHTLPKCSQHMVFLKSLYLTMSLSGQEFTAWCKQLGIKHRRITPLCPATNAQVERFNKTLEKTIRIALVEGKNWRSELFVFLMNYRNTPHPSTGVSPASLMMNRHIRTKIPCLDLSRPPKLLQIERSYDNLRKSKVIHG